MATGEYSHEPYLGEEYKKNLKKLLYKKENYESM